MPGRVRSRSFGTYTGTITHISSGTTSPETISLGSETMGDIVGDYGQPHPLSLDRFRIVVPGALSGRAEVFPIYSFDGYPFVNQAVAGPHLDTGAPPSTVSAATTVIAKTNPSRPDVSVPNFLFELKDLPSMLHLKGQQHHSNRGNNSTAAQNFGWDLLFQDLGKLFDFSGQVDRRTKELNNLHAKGGLRRKRTTFEGNATSTVTEQYFHSFEVAVVGSVIKTTSYKQWVSVNWLPDHIGIQDASELLSLARRTVHGWSFDGYSLASTIWEAVPWSWLSDYFFNVGDFLNASRNSVGATPICCVMEHVRTDHQQVITRTTPGISATPSKSFLESKSRTLASAGITATQPFLTTKQLLTLSSIALSFSK